MFETMANSDRLRNTQRVAKNGYTLKADTSTVDDRDGHGHRQL